MMAPWAQFVEEPWSHAVAIEANREAMRAHTYEANAWRWADAWATARANYLLRRRAA